MSRLEKILQWGLILLLAGAPFFSGTLEPAGVAPLRLGALLLVTILFLAFPLSFNSHEWRQNRLIFLAMSILFLWGSLSLFYSVELFESFQVILSWGYNFTLFFLAYLLFKDRSTFKKAAQVFLIATAALCLYGLYQYYYAYESILKEVLADPQKYGGTRVAYMWPLFNRRILATYYNANTFALHLVLAIILALGLWWKVKEPFRSRERRAQFLLYPFFLMLASYCLLLTGSRSGWMAAILGIGALFAFMGTKALKEKKLNLLIFALIIMAAVSFRALTYKGIPQDQPSERATSLTSPLKVLQPRAYYYQGVWEMVKEKPLQGWGLGSFGTVYHRFRQEKAEYAKFAHSFPLQLAAETGLVGLALWGVIIGGIAALFLKKRWEFRQAWENPLSSMLGASLLIIFWHALWDFDLEVVGIATFFWISLGILVAALTPSPTEELPPSPLVPLWQRLLLIAPFTVLTAFLILVPFWADRITQEGNKLLSAEHPSKAMDVFKHSLLINSYNPKTYAALSQTYLELYQKKEQNPVLLDEAQQNMEKAINLSPANYAYHSGLGWIFWLKAQKDKDFLDDAENELLKAAQLAPYSSSVHQNLYLFYKVQNRQQEAEKEQQQLDKLKAREKNLMLTLENFLKQQAADSHKK